MQTYGNVDMMRASCRHWKASKGLCAVSLAALGLALGADPAFAQAAQPPQTSPSAVSLPDGDIVVTARKQSERAQDVPMSITSVTAEKLTQVGATKILDITSIVPGLIAFSQTGAPGSVSLNIRGISTADASSITVATTLDDVPVNSSSANAYAGYAGLDLLPALTSGIEVLKGPQGTLYGASSLGGLVKYTTPTPSLTDPSAEIGAGLSTVKNGSKVGAMIRATGSVPIVSDKLSFGFALEQDYTPGYIDNRTRGEKDANHGIQRGGRLTLFFKPDEAFSLKLNAIAQTSDFNGTGAIQIDPSTQAPLDGYYNADFPLGNGTKQNTQIFTADAQWNLGGVTLTSVTGYSHLKTTFDADLSRRGFAVALGFNASDVYSFRTNKFSQEIRLGSDPSAPISWNLGGFYTSESSYYIEQAVAYDKATGAVSTVFNPLYFSDITSNYKEAAGFGSINWKITPAFDINVSGRYSGNWQEAQGNTYGLLADAEFFSPVFKSDDRKFTYAVNARYFLQPDVMVYARVATGYRPGGPNLLANVPATFAPDTTTNYEVGLKSQLFDRKLVFDLAGFLIDWKNIHVFQRQGELATYTGNAASARSQGFELSMSYRFTPELRLGINGGYTDAHLTSSYTAVAAPSGYPLPNQPKWSGAITGDWSHELGSGAKLTAGFNWLYVGPRMSDFPGASPAGIRLSSYNTLNLSTGLELGNWSLNVYARNVADKRAYVTRRNAGAVILQPRTLGFTVSRRF